MFVHLKAERENESIFPLLVHPLNGGLAETKSLRSVRISHMASTVPRTWSVCLFPGTWTESQVSSRQPGLNAALRYGMPATAWRRWPSFRLIVVSRVLKDWYKLFCSSEFLIAWQHYSCLDQGVRIFLANPVFRRMTQASTGQSGVNPLKVWKCKIAWSGDQILGFR